MEADEDRLLVRLLCSKKTLLGSSSSPAPGIRWLIGSSLFLPPFTVITSFRCIHSLSNDPFSPDFSREADEIRMLLLKGFDIVGALFVGTQNFEKDFSNKAIQASRKLRECISGDKGSYHMIGALANAMTGDIQYLVPSKSGIEKAYSVVYENNPENYLWDKGCLLRCELALKLPVFVALDGKSDIKASFSSVTESTIAKLKDPATAYLIETSNTSSDESPYSIVLHGDHLDKKADRATNFSNFCSRKRFNISTARESADVIRVTLLSNQSRSSNNKNGVPILEYIPAPEPAKLLIISVKLDVLCYTLEDFPVASAISQLIIPSLADQLRTMGEAILPEISTQQAQLCPYHFIPSGFFIPVTVIYDLRYGEMEEKQGELRKSLHLRLGLPLDRPLLRIANSLNFGIKEKRGSSLTKHGSSLLRDVHSEIPNSGVSGGIVSIIDGSYEYYHYLHDGIDDNGWGCAYRSLQTIISWYRLQQYTSLDVPSHREIQQALVEIGDKDPSFIGSREWIGAIELSFVLDKLLGVSCKIINVRSGDELPEKCRELAIHFQTQGTPIMIGGGVLAYTLLGVDYNENTGESAFLILDPHYTGTDEIKKIVSGGWCGWKKPVDNKGRSFFLKDKFYNLLLPQRPNMV